jgi:hypothetical protein
VPRAQNFAETKGLGSISRAAAQELRLSGLSAWPEVVGATLKSQRYLVRQLTNADAAPAMLRHMPRELSSKSSGRPLR